MLNDCFVFQALVTLWPLQSTQLLFTLLNFNYFLRRNNHFQFPELFVQFVAAIVTKLPFCVTSKKNGFFWQHFRQNRKKLNYMTTDILALSTRCAHLREGRLRDASLHQQVNVAGRRTSDEYYATTTLLLLEFTGAFQTMLTLSKKLSFYCQSCLLLIFQLLVLYRKEGR